MRTMLLKNMLPYSFKMRLKQSQRKQFGASLLELLTVISIVGIMAYVGVPNFSNIMVERDLNSAKTTLVQSLNKAKNIARSENTIVSVNIQNNVISLAPSNASPTQTMTMPKKIGVDGRMTFSFNATGLVANNNATTNILIKANSNSELSETITISTTGMIAAL